jgi:hypothetical protein
VIWASVLRSTAHGFRVGPELEFKLDLDFPYIEILLLGGLEVVQNIKGRYPSPLVNFGEPRLDP